MTRALLVIDIQQDYFPGGAMALVEPERAAEAAAAAIAACRANGTEVIHIQHLSTGAGATFLVPDTPGVEIHPSVAPADGELVIEKHRPNSFVGTPLEEELRARDIDELIVSGMMTSMCVDATTRAARDRGYGVTLVHDACAAPDLTFGETTVPGAQVHAAFVAALGSAYATVVAHDEL